MTGVEIGEYFDQFIDKSWSSYYDSVKMNRLLKNTLILVCEKKYLGLATQKQYDETRNLISSEYSWIPKNNSLRLTKNYFTLVANDTVNNIWTFRTARSHNLSIGDLVKISGVDGFTPAPNNTSTPQTVLALQYLPAGNYFSTTAPVTVGGAWVPNTGWIESEPVRYMHLFAVKVKFKELVKGVNITGTMANVPGAVKTDSNKHSNLRTGESITFSSMYDPALNGTFYIKVANSKLIELYTDKDLLIPAPNGAGSTTRGGLMHRTFYEYATPYTSDRKIDVLGQPSIRVPGYSIADEQLKLYPLNESALEVTVDYFKEPEIFIDVSNATLNLEGYYPLKFLHHLIDEAVKIYTGPSRDQYLSQDASIKIIQNP